MCEDFRVNEAAVASVGRTRGDDSPSHSARLFLMIEVSRPLNSKGEAAARYFCFHIRRFRSAVYEISSTVIAFCIKIPNHHRRSSKHLIAFMISSGIRLDSDLSWPPALHVQGFQIHVRLWNCSLTSRNSLTSLNKKSVNVSSTLFIGCCLTTTNNNIIIW